jgi:hypothetical protein
MTIRFSWKINAEEIKKLIPGIIPKSGSKKRAGAG